VLILRDIGISRIALDIGIELADTGGNFLVPNRNTSIARGIGKTRGRFYELPRHSRSHGR